VPAIRRAVGQARRIVRHKSAALPVQDPDAAALTMDLRGYDFHLFSDDHGGQDAVVYRGAQTGYRVAFAGPVRHRFPATAAAAVMDAEP